jgi:hypothetical protein
MPERRVQTESDGIIRKKPHRFVHNELVVNILKTGRGVYVAWVCWGCGIVKLENFLSIGLWTCEVCKVRFKQ